MARRMLGTMVAHHFFNGPTTSRSQQKATSAKPVQRRSARALVA
jgi:ribosomal protein S21